MEEALVKAIEVLGTKGAWGLIVYKLIDWAELVTVIVVIWWGAKKAASWLKKNL